MLQLLEYYILYWRDQKDFLRGKKLNKNEKQVTSTMFFDEKFIINQMNQVKIVQVDIHICFMIRVYLM